MHSQDCGLPNETFCGGTPDDEPDERVSSYCDLCGAVWDATHSCDRESNTLVSDEPHYDGSDDCPHCEGDGCDECDYTGEYA